MLSPYIITKLYAEVSLHPSQMGNGSDIYKYLKGNLANKFEGKCYKNYGFIVKIIKIEEIAGGELRAEDKSASAYYNVKFVCKLCKPLSGTTIICEVIKINKSLVYLNNGPIQMMIFDFKTGVNLNNFTYDEKRDILLANIGGGKGVPVVPGTAIKIKVGLTKLEKKQIIVLGTLEGLPTKEEKIQASINSENLSDDPIDYENYVNPNPVPEHSESEQSGVKTSKVVEQGVIKKKSSK